MNDTERVEHFGQQRIVGRQARLRKRDGTPTTGFGPVEGAGRSEYGRAHGLGVNEEANQFFLERRVDGVRLLVIIVLVLVLGIIILTEVVDKRTEDIQRGVHRRCGLAEAVQQLQQAAMLDQGVGQVGTVWTLAFLEDGDGLSARRLGFGERPSFAQRDRVLVQEGGVVARIDVPWFGHGNILDNDAGGIARRRAAAARSARRFSDASGAAIWRGGLIQWTNDGS